MYENCVQSTRELNSASSANQRICRPIFVSISLFSHSVFKLRLCLSLFIWWSFSIEAHLRVAIGMYFVNFLQTPKSSASEFSESTDKLFRLFSNYEFNLDSGTRICWQISASISLVTVDTQCYKEFNFGSSASQWLWRQTPASIPLHSICCSSYI